MDIDEAKYLLTGLRVADDVAGAQVADLVHLHFYEPTPYAPLLGLVSAPFLFGGDSVRVGLLALLPFLAILVASTFAIVRRLTGDARWALAGAALVGLSPFVTEFTGHYHFALPSAALLAASVWALLRTERMADLRWAVLWGALVGACLLTRTLMVAIVPGLVVAALLGAVIESDDRVRRVGRMVAGIAVAAVVAGPWYLANRTAVADYLTGFGYGADADVYGESHPVASLDFWLSEVRGFRSDATTAVAVLVALGIAAGLVVVARSRPAGLWRSDVLAVSVVAVWGYLALTSSANEGTGFRLPLLSLVVALALAGLSRLPAHAAKVALAVVLVVSLTGVAATRPSRVDRYARDHGYDEAVDVGPVVRQVVSDIDDIHAGVAIPTGDALFNENMLRLVIRQELEANVAVSLVTSEEGDTVDDHRSAVRSGSPRHLVTFDPPPVPLPTSGDVRKTEAAARVEGYRVIAAYELPDGRQARLWKASDP